MDKSKEELLNKLLTVRFGTINNFYSRSAVTEDGMYLQPTRHFKALLKKGLIRQLGEKTYNYRRLQFFTINKKGADYIGRGDDYSYTEIKSPDNIKHESAKIDIALSFYEINSDYEFEYNTGINGLRPDIIVRGDHDFLIEIERKRRPGRTFNEKILRYEKILSKYNLKKYNLSKQIKVLVIYANSHFDPLWRPQEYKYHQKEIEFQETQLSELIKLSKNLPDRYRFITLDKFTSLNLPIWYNVKGQRVKIV